MKPIEFWRGLICAMSGAAFTGLATMRFLPDLWGLWALLGGIGAWILYNPRAFGHGFSKACQVAWTEVTKTREPKPKQTPRTKEQWSYIFWKWLSNVTLVSLILVSFLLAAFANPEHKSAPPDSLLFVMGVPGVLLVLFAIVSLMYEVSENTYFSLNCEPRELLLERTKKLRFCALFLNPITFPFTAIYFVCEWIQLSVWNVLKFIGWAVWKTVMFTFSDGRTASLMGSVAGSIVGHTYFADEWLACAVGGGFVFLLLYAANRYWLSSHPQVTA